jgi:hypothetical protein
MVGLGCGPRLQRGKPGGGELGNGDAVTRESDWRGIGGLAMSLVIGRPAAREQCGRTAPRIGGGGEDRPH